MPRSSTAKLRKARGSVHGDFDVGAAIAQGTADIWRGGPNWSKLNATQKESLQMIAHKVQRILTGDPDFPDHWDDIAGYAHLPIAKKPARAKRVAKKAAKKAAKKVAKKVAKRVAKKAAKKRTLSPATKKKISQAIKATAKKKAAKPAVKKFAAKPKAKKKAAKPFTRRAAKPRPAVQQPASDMSEAA